MRHLSSYFYVVRLVASNHSATHWRDVFLGLKETFKCIQVSVIKLGDTLRHFCVHVNARSFPGLLETVIHSQPSLSDVRQGLLRHPHPANPCFGDFKWLMELFISIALFPSCLNPDLHGVYKRICMFVTMSARQSHSATDLYEDLGKVYYY